MSEKAAHHREMLEEIEDRRAELQAELRDLNVVRRYLLQELEEMTEESEEADGEARGEDEISKKVWRNLLFHLEPDAKRHEAAKHALEFLDRPSRIPEIIGILRDVGYTEDKDYNTLADSLRKALTRRPDLFRKGKRGTWELRKLK